MVVGSLGKPNNDVELSNLEKCAFFSDDISSVCNGAVYDCSKGSTADASHITTLGSEILRLMALEAAGKALIKLITQFNVSICEVRFKHLMR